MKYVFSLLVAFIIVLLLITTISLEVAPPDAEAVATYLEGSALLFTSDAPAGRLIRTNDIIKKNDRVEVQENSRLELRFPDGSYARLSENASLTLLLLQYEKRTGSLYMQAVLGRGKLWAKVKKLATPASRFEVLTSAGLAAAKGTVYGVDVEEGESAVIKVYEGVVLASGAGRESKRTDGYTSTQWEVPPVSVNAVRQVSVSAQEGVSQPQDFDPKATINDWSRWNLQRDAREGLVSVTVAPVSSTITRGTSQQFSGTAHYPDNIEKDVTWFATWSSSNVNVAKIDQAGAVRGQELGTAGISAAIVDMSGLTSTTVTRELLSIVVTPASRSIVNGSVQQFTATGTFSDKTVKDITSSAVWKSSDTAVAAVDANGRATAGDKAGNVVISASLGKKSGSVALTVRRELLSITVVPGGATIMAGTTQQFRAMGNYTDKTTQDLTSSAKWQTSDARIAAAGATGLVTANSEKGSAAVTASFGGKSGSGTITVTKIELVSLTVQPAEASIRQMMLQQFTATASFSDGSTQDLTKSVAWTSSAPLLAPIKATGVASGVLPGSIVITATSQGVSASSDLHVKERFIYRPRADEETLKKFVYWPAPRFAKVEGGQSAHGAAVVDNLSGLLWTTDAATPGPPACTPGVKKTSQAALAYIACLNSNGYLGYRNWRLPSREELLNLVDYKQSVPNSWVYTRGFSYIQAYYGYELWFSNPEGAFTTIFDVGYGDAFYVKGTMTYHVWPVRSAK